MDIDADGVIEISCGKREGIEIGNGCPWRGSENGAGFTKCQPPHLVKGRLAIVLKSFQQFEEGLLPLAHDHGIYPMPAGKNFPILVGGMRAAKHDKAGRVDFFCHVRQPQ
jgi:hypothetical protein